MHDTFRGRAVRSRWLHGAAVLALLAGADVASAQTAPVQRAPEEIVVTGSRIRQANIESTSPIAVVSSEEIRLTGAARVEDLLNNLPQVFADQGAYASNGSTGTANLNLRNLGSSRTLVLIDGKRMPAGTPVNGGEAPDINQIPESLIKRIEIVTGGASAVYGSDAIAGVVNFIMDKDFEGVRVDSQYSFTQHHNSNTDIQAVVQKRNFALPDSDIVTGIEKTFSSSIGIANAKGGVQMYANYRNIKPILQDHFDYSSCSLNAGTSYSCGGSSTSYPGRFILDGGNGASVTINSAGAGNTFRPFTTSDQYNFGPINYFQRPDKRYSAGAFAHYEIAPAIEAYANFMFHDDKTVAQIAPSGIFLQGQNVPCSNPLLSAQQVQTLCTQFGLTSADSANVLIGRRNVEGGGRQDDLRNTSYNFNAGIRGDILGGWHYDVYAQYATVVYAETYHNDFSLARTARALDVVTNPANGQPICRSALNGTDPACVPYNIFQIGGVTPAALNYLQTPGFQRGSTTLEVVSGSITGDLGKYGVRLPWAKSGVSVAFGAEYRRNELDRSVDAEFDTGDLAGQGGATHGVTGAYDSREVFTEGHVPLIEDMAFAKAINFDYGYRYSKYSTSGSANTWKLAADWSPTDDVKLRTTFNRAVRAPTVIDLFVPQATNLNLSNDPCAGTSPTASFAQCARTGVSAGQYGRILSNSAGQYNDLEGGNTHLKPEVALTFTAGAVFTPSFLKNFSATVDYFRINIRDTIGTIGADTILATCLQSGDPTFCGLVHRSPGTGSLWLAPNGFVTNTNLNSGSLKTSGVDLQANYRIGLPDYGVRGIGDVTLSFLGTVMSKYEVQPITNGDRFDCAGLYGPQCGGSSNAPVFPKWRHKMRVTWEMPWDASLSVAWRHMSSTQYEQISDQKVLQAAGSSPLSATLPQTNYFDLAAQWAPVSWLTLTGGVNNVFDKSPPIVGSGVVGLPFLNGNTLPQVYDIGRYFFFSASAKF